MLGDVILGFYSQTDRVLSISTSSQELLSLDSDETDDFKRFRLCPNMAEEPGDEVVQVESCWLSVIMVSW